MEGRSVLPHRTFFAYANIDKTAEIAINALKQREKNF